jgi:hypothetical protein
VRISPTVRPTPTSGVPPPVCPATRVIVPGSVVVDDVLAGVVRWTWRPS